MIRHLTILVLLFIRLNISAQAPQYAWSGHLPAREYYSQGVACNRSNDIFSFGTLQGTVDLDPGPGQYTVSSVSAVAYLVKLNQQGNLVWAKTFNAFIYDVSFDLNGWPVLAAYFMGTADLDPGAGTQFFTSQGAINACVIKLDNNGNLAWARQFTGDAYCEPWAVNCDKAGNVLLTGRYNGNVDFDPGAGTCNFYQSGQVFSAGFVCKLDVNGNFIWARNFPSKAMMGSDIVSDAAGNVYFTGSFADSVDFDPGVGTFYLWQQQFQIFACKLSPLGDFIWAGEFGGYAADRPGKIALDSRNNVYVSAYFKGVGDVDPGPGVVNIPAGNKWVPAFVCKLDSAGKYLNVLSDGAAGTWVQDLAIDSLDNLYMTGLYTDTLDLDGGPGTATFSTHGYNDVFISKLDQALKLQWCGLLKGNADATPAMAVDRYQNIFIQGLYKDTLDCDPGAQVQQLITGTVSTGYILKLASGLQPPPPPPSTAGFSNADHEAFRLSLYPNPTTGKFTIRAEGIPDLDAVLYDVAGRAYKIAVLNGEADLSGFPQGIYVVEITTTSGTVRGRVLRF